MRFYDRADAIQTKTIMALADILERFAAPILCGRVESSFWFTQNELESVIVDAGTDQQCAVAAIMLEGVGKNLHKHFLEKLWINTQHHVRKLHTPINFAPLV